MQIACGNDRPWQSLCAALDLDAPDGQLSSIAERVARRAEVIELVGSALTSRGRDEVLELVDASGIAAGRVRDLQEVYEWDQTRSQGLVIDVDHPSLGTIQLPAHRCATSSTAPVRRPR